MQIKLPSVTFIVCTYNSEKIIRECLNSIKKLDYPHKLIRAIVWDGESQDKTVAIAKSYPFVKVFVKKTDGPEIATAMAYNKADTDLVVNFPSDNVIRSRNWLKRMVQPFLDERTIIASETLHYSYVKNDKPLNRYFALFGMNDPVAYYLGKCDRASYLDNGWHLAAAYKDKGDYYRVRFTKENLPTMGANGFVVRRKIISKVSKNPYTFFHIDTCSDLVGMGFDTFALVKNDIWHKTGEEFWNFLRKRRKYAAVLYFNKKSIRRYHLYDPEKDRAALLKYVFYSLTVMQPLFLALRGFFKIRDFAWFYHPLICFSLTLVYVYTGAVYYLSNVWRNTLRAIGVRTAL